MAEKREGDGSFAQTARLINRVKTLTAKSKIICDKSGGESEEPTSQPPAGVGSNDLFWVA